jgi:hypothetical protein
VSHRLTENIGQSGFWGVSDEFIINVQDDNNDDETSSDSFNSMEIGSQLAQPL